MNLLFSDTLNSNKLAGTQETFKTKSSLERRCRIYLASCAIFYCLVLLIVRYYAHATCIVARAPSCMSHHVVMLVGKVTRCKSSYIGCIAG